MKIDTNTIMPDGRPLFAWENQMGMQVSELRNLREKIEEMILFQQMMGVIWKTWREDATNDWLFAIKRDDAITATDFKYNLEKYLKVIPPTSHKEGGNKNK